MNRIENRLKEKLDVKGIKDNVYTRTYLVEIMEQIAKEAFDAGQNSIIESPGYWEVKGMAYPLKPNFQEWLKGGEK